MHLVGDLLLREFCAAPVVAHGLPRPRRLLAQQVQPPLSAEAPAEKGEEALVEPAAATSDPFKSPKGGPILLQNNLDLSVFVRVPGRAL